MAGRTLKSLVSRRRRNADDGEDTESVVMIEDSQSEASFASDADEEASDLSGTDTELTRNESPPVKASESVAATRRVKEKRARKGKRQGKKDVKEAQPVFSVTADTEMMLNGVKRSEVPTAKEVEHFQEVTETDRQDTAAAAEDTAAAAEDTGKTGPSKPETPLEQRRREHEEYKKRRDADPAFIPNRGNFFMHDTRAAPGGSATFAQPRGRGRGRPMVGGPFSPANQMAQAEKVASAPWAHDLHEAINEPVPRSAPQSLRVPQQPLPAHSPVEPTAPPTATPTAPPTKASTNRPSLSCTTLIGKANFRVFLPGMEAPIAHSGFPVKSHTRLPDHRPPMRRDKPVRVYIAPHEPRQVFPSEQRSFIFIPRAERPNKQGFSRMRGSYGGFGGYSSRRTSIYGGSVYSPSITMSRRSSFAREISRDAVISPAGSFSARQTGFAPPVRPIVRLPHGAPVATSTGPFLAPGGGTPSQYIPRPGTYPLPQNPQFRENWTIPITIHQPRPQKQISVTGIESPATLSVHAPEQKDQQPFHNQLPPISVQQVPPEQSSFYPQQTHPYAGPITTGTPLSNIPERAIHAQPFQPPLAPYGQPTYYPQYPSQPGYYYPPPPVPGQQSYMYVPSPQSSPYVMPPPPPVAPSAIGATPAGTVAHESNGMVYYINATEVPQYPPTDPAAYQAPPESYAPAMSYAVPGVGGIMTPSPEGYYYPPGGALYYAQHQ
ncbi:hypothetical protein LTR66_010294 [Elasticomyces elasticus]|nr:hypothetical protein LTR66_010294 [Elasticomyces elasticus]